MSKKYTGTTLTDKAPSGDMLYGTKTEGEKQNEEKEYREKNLNESK